MILTWLHWPYISLVIKQHICTVMQTGHLRELYYLGTGEMTSDNLELCFVVNQVANTHSSYKIPFVLFLQPSLIMNNWRRTEVPVSVRQCMFSYDLLPQQSLPRQWCGRASVWWRYTTIWAIKVLIWSSVKLISQPREREKLNQADEYRISPWSWRYDLTIP